MLCFWVGLYINILELIDWLDNYYIMERCAVDYC